MLSNQAIPQIVLDLAVFQCHCLPLLTCICLCLFSATIIWMTSVMKPLTNTFQTWWREVWETCNVASAWKYWRYYYFSFSICTCWHLIHFSHTVIYLQYSSYFICFSSWIVLLRLFFEVAKCTTMQYIILTFHFIFFMSYLSERQ